MVNITYLFGAGASANELPLIRGIKDELIAFKKKIIDVKEGFEHSEKFNETDQKIYIDTISDLGWLISEVSNHATIDTFAKKLFLIDDIPNLKKLKGLIDLFFVYKQNFPKKVDNRYDTFLATILKSEKGINLSFPHNIKIISWNYDNQFELSANNFFKLDDDLSIQNRLNIIPGVSDFNKDNFGIIKLNGTAAGLIDFSEEFKSKNYFILDGSNESNIFSLIKNYIIYKDSNYKSSILFAWENNQIQETVRNYAKKIISETEILIIIGYSFPTFNRFVDKDILSNNNFKKIIIQSDNIETATNAKFRLENLLPNGNSNYNKNLRIDNIEINTAKDEFLIPFEFN